jgi:hypothetical protein
MAATAACVGIILGIQQQQQQQHQQQQQ